MSVDRRALRFTGYSRPELPPEDAELTHVGRRTPAGEYLRRFWHPVAMTAEIGDLPLRIRIMGEDLVLYRDRLGRYGLLDLHCSHRGSSLEFGIVTDRGLSCCYHGWLYDLDGTVLETPGEPSGSRLKDGVRHGAYPAREWGGLVFAYMGPPEEEPPFPIFDPAMVAGNRTVAYSLLFECNWLQVHENCMDPLHSVFLHTRTSGTQFAEAFGAMPIVSYEKTRLGMVSTAVRRWGDNVWVRTNDAIMPNIAQFGPPWEDGSIEKVMGPAAITRWVVPIDDVTCMTIGVRHFNDKVDPDGRGIEAAVGKGTVDFLGQTPERPYAERQRVPGDYDAQVSQRPIAIHGVENLGSTDAGVAMLRRLIRRGIRNVASGKRLAPAPALDSGVVPTYSHDTVIRAARSASDDDAFLAAIGRRVFGIVSETMDVPPQRRAAEVASRLEASSG